MVSRLDGPFDFRQTSKDVISINSKTQSISPTARSTGTTAWRSNGSGCCQCPTQILGQTRGPSGCEQWELLKLMDNCVFAKLGPPAWEIMLQPPLHDSVTEEHKGTKG